MSLFFCSISYWILLSLSLPLLCVRLFNYEIVIVVVVLFNVLFYYIDIIHTVAPQGESPAMVAKCYKAIFDLVKENALTSIAIPTIAALSLADAKNHITVGVQKTREFLETHYSDIDRIVFCSQTVEEENVYKKLLKSYFPLK